MPIFTTFLGCYAQILVAMLNLRTKILRQGRIIMKNSIENYAPISLKIAELEPRETHHHSFFVTPCRKQWIAGYKPEMLS